MLGSLTHTGGALRPSTNRVHSLRPGRTADYYLIFDCWSHEAQAGGNPTNSPSLLKPTCQLCLTSLGPEILILPSGFIAPPVAAAGKGGYSLLFFFFRLKSLVKPFWPDVPDMMTYHVLTPPKESVKSEYNKIF